MPRISTIARPFILAATAGAGMLIGATIDANGVPHKRYRKDLIRVGDWVMPGNGVEFSVTRADLEHWAATHDALTSNGVKVPVPLGHNTDPERNSGYVLSISVDGDTLIGEVELIGADAIELASKTEVSIYVPTEMKDGKGNVYQRPIAHVALTPVPVISGQGGFVPIAASRGGSDKVPVLTLAGSNRMDWKAVAAALGISADGLDDQGLYDAILAKAKTLCAGEAEMSKAKEQVTALSRDLELSRAELAKVAKPAEKPSTLMLSLAGENRRMKIDALVTAGKISAATAKGLKTTWGEGEALALSLDTAGIGRFDATLEALSLNTPIPAGESTKGQYTALSRDEKNAEAKAEADLIAELSGTKS
jgi:hypothetical protein